MKYVNYNFVGSFGKAISAAIDPQELVNMYQIFDKDYPKQTAAIFTPGSLLKISPAVPANFTVRVGFVFGKSMYFVVGSSLIKYDGLLSPSVVGTLSTETGFVGVSANQTQVILVDGGTGYIWDGAAFQSISDPNFPNSPGDVTYLDGRFYVINNTTNQFNASDVEDGLTYNATNFAKLTTTADILVNIKMLKRHIYLMGQKAIEVWYDGGGGSGGGFPLLRDNALVYSFGSAAVGSAVVKHGHLIWLARNEDGSVGFQLTDGGADPIPISSPQVDLALQALSAPQDCQALMYKINGYTFYIASFTTDALTFQYNLQTKQWNTLETNNSRYFGSTHTFFDNKHFMGAYDEGKIYEISGSYTNHNGTAIKRRRVSGIFESSNGKRINIDLIELQFKQGLEKPAALPITGIYLDDLSIPYTDDAGEPYYADTYSPLIHNIAANPTIYLSYSTDGGSTYSYPEEVPLGKVGKYEYRSEMRRLGEGDSFVFKMECYADVPLILLGANVGLEEIGF